MAGLLLLCPMGTGFSIGSIVGITLGCTEKIGAQKVYTGFVVGTLGSAIMIKLYPWSPDTGKNWEKVFPSVVIGVGSVCGGITYSITKLIRSKM